MRFSPARTLVPALAALLLAPTGALAQGAAIVGEFKLPEGVYVLTAEEHSAPTVVVDTWIAAGSAQDFEGYRGVALQLARTLAAGIQTDVKALGGSTTVEVDRDYSHIALTLPAAKLDDGLALAGKAMADPAWDVNPAPLPAPLAPLEAVAFEGFMAQVYGPEYGHPPTGNKERAIGKPEAKTYFDRYYQPGRMAVVLSGDFATGKAVGAVVRSYAAALKRTPSESPVPARQGRPSDGLGKPARPVVVSGVRGPDAKVPREQAAMEMVGQVVGKRVERALMEIPGTRLADVRFRRYAGPSPLVVTVEAGAEAAPKVDAAVRGIVEALRNTPATLEEHARAQQAVATAAVVDPRDLAGHAKALGWAALVGGDRHLARTYPEIVRQVSRQDMLETVQKYASPDALRVITLTP